MKNIICIFAKPPLPGRTKSRLAASVGNIEAAELSEIMLQCLIRESENSIADEVILWGSPESCVDDFNRIDFGKATFEVQNGNDLGARMGNCFQNYLNLAKSNVIIIGSDCISHNSELLSSAFVMLPGNEIIIQPATDGGYVLIGQSKYNSDMFEKIIWGTDIVFKTTIDLLNKNSCKYKILPEAFDVDTLDDLKVLFKFASANSIKEILNWFQKYSLP
ncbi:MAG: hypothetical protein COA79_20480 [Planctomycetota bacterium]|nr:MAG: hypothetical protein COA79_20480 [Planctomycetota bacterium]